MDKKIVSEASLMEATAKAIGGPVTRERLLEDFASLGIAPGQVLMIHSSLKSIGWVPGGVQLVMEALLECLGPQGTLMVPTHTTHLTDPATWAAPPAPKDWHEAIRNGYPAFNPLTTQTRGMGVLCEAARRWPGAVRSDHPHTSFCAIGPQAKDLMADHALASPMGTRSPLQKLYDADGSTFLLGVGFGNNTCFHLAEDSLENPPRLIDGAPILQNGKQAWVKFDAIDYDDKGFVDCGASFEKTGQVKRGKIGLSNSLFFRTKSAVDFAKTWLRQNR